MSVSVLEQRSNLVVGMIQKCANELFRVFGRHVNIQAWCFNGKVGPSCSVVTCDAFAEKPPTPRNPLTAVVRAEYRRLGCSAVFAGGQRKNPDNRFSQAALPPCR